MISNSSGATDGEDRCADDAESSAGYDPAKPDFLVHGPDELFQTLQAGLAPYLSSQHNVGVIHVSLSDSPKPRWQLATITAHETAVRALP
jgi:hypothetical protein